MTKRCAECRQVKSLDQYSRRTRAPDGLQYSCKPCMRKSALAWEVKYPGRKTALTKRRYQETRCARLEHQRQWRKDNPKKARAQYRRAALKRRGRMAQSYIEDVDPDVIYIMHGGMCGICQEFVAYDEFEVDHIIPIAQGGRHGYVNVQPAHQFCNRSKGGRLQSAEKHIIEQLDQQ